MGYFLFINAATGRVGSALIAESLNNYIIPTGIEAIETDKTTYDSFVGANPKTHRMNYSDETFALEATPSNPATIDKTSITGNGIDTAKISNIVENSIIVVEGIGSYSVDDGEFEFSIDTPGTYLIECVTHDYLNGEFTVDAS